MMTRRTMAVGMAASSAAGILPQITLAADLAALDLPVPRREGGKPLMDALMLRHSTRAYVPTPLPIQTLSDLLWAANGVNRPSGDRTAPYWRHIMVIDIYVAIADGVWLYEPQTHSLKPYLAGDIRAETGMQDFVGVAPLDLIYVAHGERMTDVNAEDRRLYASVDAGFIGQNVYLFCASAGLGTVFRGAVPYEALTKRLSLPPDQFVVFAQTVGFPSA
jgi:nitroreductase